MKCLLCSQTNLTSNLVSHEFSEKIDGESCLRRYYLCSYCDLIFLDPSLRLSVEAEKQRYEHHRNEMGDSGYIQYLNQIVFPLVPLIPAEAEGLDYGSGPNPVLSEYLGNYGCKMKIYDPFFAEDKSVLEKKYDFVVATEVIEHFFDPAAEFERLESLLKTDGALALLTQFHNLSKDDLSEIEKWHYRKDPTHVCFYSAKTFDYIASEFNLEILYQNNPAIVMARKLEN